MKEMPVGEARTHLSAAVRSAQNGPPTTITKRGRPVARIVFLEEARSLYPEWETTLSKSDDAGCLDTTTAHSDRR